MLGCNDFNEPKSNIIWHIDDPLDKKSTLK